MSSESLLKTLVRHCRAGNGVASSVDDAADLYRLAESTPTNERDLMNRFVHLIRHLHREAGILPIYLSPSDARERVLSLLNRFYRTTGKDGFAEAYMQVMENGLQSLEEVEDHLIQMLKEDAAARDVALTIHGYLSQCTWQDRVALAEAVLKEYSEGPYASIDISDAWKFAGCVEELLQAHIASVSEVLEPDPSVGQVKTLPPETFP